MRACYAKKRELCGGVYKMLYNDDPLIIPMPGIEPEKGQLLSAEESRKRADKKTNEALTKELQEVATKINTASREGKYSYSEDRCLTSEIRTRLEALGYKVEVGSQYNQSYYSISWK